MSEPQQRPENVSAGEPKETGRSKTPGAKRSTAKRTGAARASRPQRNGDARGLWILRGLALAIAFVAWTILSFLPRVEETSEPQITTEIQASLAYETLDQYILLNAASHTVTVRVRGRAERVRTLSSEEVDIQVPFPRDFRPNEPTEVVLSVDDVTLPEDLEAESINPDRLTLLIDHKERVQKPVRPVYVGEPAARATVNHELTKVVPAQVYVEGPRAQLSATSEITTMPINLAGHGIPFREQVGLQPPTGAIRVLQPTLVTVHVVLEAPGVADVVPGVGR